ncbi:hypothetical protein [Acinetobacter haemolyticus]|uniref:hypothetical protein n=1 Tax=Acinetobacter haemolyticus TaxID=29430 RepID=UPI0002F9C729|nr:hypothetical protein [Acinetobacter haemolyticus]
MKRNPQSEVLFKEILANIFRLVVLYSCERIKAKNKFPRIYQWIEENNEMVKTEIQSFFKKNVKNPQIKIKKHGKHQTINLDLEEEDLIYEFNQYFWDYIQYQEVQYNRALLSSLELKEKTVEDFFNKISSKLSLAKKLGIMDEEFVEFSEKYAYSPFVAKDRVKQAIFKYFQIYAELMYPDAQLGTQNLHIKFIELLKQIPYYSIFGRTSITGFSSYRTKIGKRYYSTLKTPLDFTPGTLIDNLLHFLFQHLIELFYFEYLYDDPQNFNARKAAGLPEDPLEFEQECVARLNECNKVMKLLLQAWPKEQHLVYRSVKDESSIIPVLRSILYADFTDGESAQQSSRTDAEARNHIESFFKFLEKGFEDMSFMVNLNLENDKTDKWSIQVFGSKEKEGKKTVEKVEILDWNWNAIRSMYKTHKKDKKLFNYE